MVMLRLKGDELHIHNEQRAFLFKHSVAQSKGNKIIYTDHNRDKSQKLKELEVNISTLFINSLLAT